MLHWSQVLIRITSNVVGELVDVETFLPPLIGMSHHCQVGIGGQLEQSHLCGWINKESHKISVC
jgi:hypothetical protein